MDAGAKWVEEGGSAKVRRATLVQEDERRTWLEERGRECLRRIPGDRGRMTSERVVCNAFCWET